MNEEEEKRLLEESLTKALNEALTKTNAALEAVTQSSADYEKAVWLAAESVEYTSLLFSLKNDVKSADAETRSSKATGTLLLVKESVDVLERVRRSGRENKVEEYRSLRRAAQNLWTAHLDLLKKPRRRGQNLTR